MTRRFKGNKADAKPDLFLTVQDRLSYHMRANNTQRSGRTWPRETGWKTPTQNKNGETVLPVPCLMHRVSPEEPSRSSRTTCSKPAAHGPSRAGASGDTNIGGVSQTGNRLPRPLPVGRPRHPPKCDLIRGETPTNCRRVRPLEVAQPSPSRVGSLTLERVERGRGHGGAYGAIGSKAATRISCTAIHVNFGNHSVAQHAPLLPLRADPGGNACPFKRCYRS